MSQPTTIDLLPPYDPTGYTTITAAQLYQLVSGLYPNAGVGFVIASTDTAGVPNVPNASSTTKWQNYVWLRITSTAAVPYIWNPEAASDPTYLQWQTIAAASIGVGTIVNAMIADNTIQDSKIVNLSYSKLTGTPTGLPPSGAAGGALTGNYPNPSIAAGAVTGSMVAAATLAGGASGNLISKTIDPPNDVKPSGTGYAFLRTNAGATATEWAVADIIDSNLAVSGNGLKVPRVNSGATAYELVSSNTSSFGRILQRAFTSNATPATSSGNVSTIGAPNYNATGMNAYAGLNTAFMPLSASSTLIVKLRVFLFMTNTNSNAVVGLYTNTGATAPTIVGVQAMGGSTTLLSAIEAITSYAPGSSSTINFKAAWGVSAGTGYINSTDGSTVLFGGVYSSLEIIEYI